MSLKFIKGNVFNVPAQVVVNTVNCVGVMGAGVAKNYKQLYPNAFLAYKRACSSGQMQIGKILAQNLPDGKIGLCVPTKEDWRNPSQLDWIIIAIYRIKEFCIKYKIKSIAVPPLGCGNGGLDFHSQVRPLMVEMWDSLETEIIVAC